jgi:leucyl aminopeptidase
MKIIQSNEINNLSGYVIIPFLESQYTIAKHNSGIYNMLEQILKIDAKYKSICEKIDKKMQNKLINIATLTIARDARDSRDARNFVGGAKGIRVSKTKKASNFIKINNTIGSLLQIYLIMIDDSSKTENELYEELRVNGHLIYNIMKNNFIRNCNLIPLLGTRNSGKNENNNNNMIKCILEGIMLSSYKFDKYKTSQALDSKQDLKYNLENLFLVGKISNQELARINTLVQYVFLARDLVNEPANDNRMVRFLEAIRLVITQNKIPVELEVLNKKTLENMGMGLILGVGKGSTIENAPCMVIIKYNPNSANTNKQDKPDWVLLGKGITFDTGGLDLKTPTGMLDMKSDLSGAAAVISFLLGYAKSSGKKCIYAICPFAENSISSRAVKPSDVLKAYDGRTVEVIDTDAEGRLILADALAYTVSKWPSAAIMDFATLTGQAESISGKAFSCILSVNAEKETSELVEKSYVINEALVRLPLLEKESSKLKSNVADIKNVNYKSSADIIMSSLFMKQFIKPKTKWIHVDIAGPAFGANQVVKYASPEASGVGVRLLFEYFNK